MTWYDGGKLPPKELFQGEKLVTHDGGSLVIGSKGTLFTRTWHGGDSPRNMFVLLPQATFDGLRAARADAAADPLDTTRNGWTRAAARAMPLSHFATRRS